MGWFNHQVYQLVLLDYLTDSETSWGDSDFEPLKLPWFSCVFGHKFHKSQTECSSLWVRQFLMVPKSGKNKLRLFVYPIIYSFFHVFSTFEVVFSPDFRIINVVCFHFSNFRVGCWHLWFAETKKKKKVLAAWAWAGAESLWDRIVWLTLESFSSLLRISKFT